MFCWSLGCLFIAGGLEFCLLFVLRHGYFLRSSAFLWQSGQNGPSIKQEDAMDAELTEQLGYASLDSKCSLI